MFLGGFVVFMLKPKRRSRIGPPVDGGTVNPMVDAIQGGGGRGGRKIRGGRGKK